jgi:hypothetical protein
MLYTFWTLTAFLIHFSIGSAIELIPKVAYSGMALKEISARDENIRNEEVNNQVQVV